jgi:hypothetical protein
MRRAFEAAGGFSRFRVENHRKQGDRAFIIFASSAKVAHPGWEVRDCNEFISQPGEISDMTPVHDARRTLVARHGLGSGRFLSFFVHLTISWIME